MWWIGYVFLLLMVMTLFINSGRISRSEEEKKDE